MMSYMSESPKFLLLTTNQLHLYLLMSYALCEGREAEE